MERLFFILKSEVMFMNGSITKYTEVEDEFYIENAEELDSLIYSEVEKKHIFKSVRVTKKDFSIYELYRKYLQGKLILDVYFQRNYVWENKQKSELIESILMGLPLPIFYFKQQDNSTYVVVDGKQRLSTLFLYFTNEFSLKNLKILSFLNNKKFSDLSGELGIYQSQLEDYQVYSHVILPPTPDRILFDIFDRVNRGGTRLNKQEIRNALYQGVGLDMINNLAETEEFQNATRIQNQKDKRMKGSYLLTRFFAFYLLFNNYIYDENGLYNYNGDIDDLIEKTLCYLNSCDERSIANFKYMSLECLIKVNFCFGLGAFRKEMKSSNPINMNIFETSMFLMSILEEKPKDFKARIQNKLLETITSHEYLSCIGDSRDSYEKVIGRFSLMKKIVEEV